MKTNYGRCRSIIDAANGTRTRIPIVPRIYTLSLRDALQRGLDRWEKLAERRDAILKTLSKADTLTPALKSSILQAASLNQLEDIYLP